MVFLISNVINFFKKEISDKLWPKHNKSIPFVACFVLVSSYIYIRSNEAPESPHEYIFKEVSKAIPQAQQFVLLNIAEMLNRQQMAMQPAESLPFPMMS